MNVPNIDELRKNVFTIFYARKHYPEFEKFISTKYPDDISWREKLYWYANNISTYVLCPECGKRLGFLSFGRGYHKYCCRWCKYKSEGPVKALKETCLKKYGYDSFSRTPGFSNMVKKICKEKYGVENVLLCPEIREKFKNTMKERYGVEHALQSKQFLSKFENTMKNKYDGEYSGLSKELREKTENTKLKKYGDPYYSDREKLKKTCLKRYGDESAMRNPHVIQKGYQTRKKNHTFNTSKIEQTFKQWLIDNNVNFDYQHKDEKYPFNCDFYFPEKDLYLEIQGNWTHGKHPFDPNNEDDVRVVNEWKTKNHRYHRAALKIWTERDPLKRETAKKNNLNWIEVFTNDPDELIENVKSLII